MAVAEHYKNPQLQLKKHTTKSGIHKKEKREVQEVIPLYLLILS